MKKRKIRELEDKIDQLERRLECVEGEPFRFIPILPNYPTQPIFPYYLCPPPWQWRYSTGNPITFGPTTTTARPPVTTWTENTALSQSSDSLLRG